MLRFIFFLSLILPFTLHAQSEEFYLKRAEQARENNNYQEAVSYITKAIELDSFNALYYELRGRVVAGLNVDNKQLEHIDIQSFKTALSDFNKAIELEPENPDFYESRGVLYLNFRKYKEALHDFEQQLKYVVYTSEKIKAMGGKAKAKFESNEIDASFRILEEALNLDPTSVLILNDLALQYLILSEFELARKYLNKALAINSNDKITLANMGYVALKSGKYEQALNIFDLVIEKYPDVGLLYNNRGFVKFQISLIEEALDDINYSIELYPVNSYAFKNRALIYLSIEEKDKACEDLMYAKSLGYTLDYDDEVINLLIKNCLEVNKKVGDKD
jgi:tetratricopeptide (TPR) repeat protein